jgi:hypothetical protein
VIVQIHVFFVRMLSTSTLPMMMDCMVVWINAHNSTTTTQLNAWNAFPHAIIAQLNMSVLIVLKATMRIHTVILAIVHVNIVQGHQQRNA